MPALRYQFGSFVKKSHFVSLQNTKLFPQTEVTFLTAVVVGDGCGDNGPPVLKFVFLSFNPQMCFESSVLL